MRTRIEREFDPDVLRRRKADLRRDIIVDGPELAAHALQAGLVDELQMIVCPVVGAGSCAAEAGVGRRVPVPPRRGRSAVRRPRLIDMKRVDPQSFGFVSREGVKGRA